MIMSKIFKSQRTLNKETEINVVIHHSSFLNLAFIVNKILLIKVNKAFNVAFPEVINCLLSFNKGSCID